MKHRRNLAVALLLALAFTQFACPGPKLVTYARTTVSALREAMPLMAAAGINITHVQQAAEIGDRLVQALTAKDNPTAIQLTSQLISAFEAVVREVNVIHDQKARTLIMVALAVANVALHHIADVLDEESAKVPAAMRGRVAAETELIADFKRKRAWRCRSAVTGKFMVMDFCQKNPATSVVEVY